jgi:hypothetical protein
MVAATAPAHDLPVYTGNPDDFAGIDGLRVVTVPLAGGMRRARESGVGTSFRSAIDGALLIPGQV